MMQEFFDWQGLIGTIAGIIGLIFAYLAFSESRKTKRLIEKENERKGEQVKFVLTDGKSFVEMPFLRRQEVTRAEIQGRLGTIPMKKRGGRYSVEYTNTLDYYKQIDRVIDGSHESGDTVLEINCSAKEFEQFDFPAETIKKIKIEESKQIK